MNINNIPGSNIDKVADARAASDTRGSGRPSEQTEAQRTSQDSVTITDTARLLSDLKTQLHSAPVTNQAKVSQIRDALQAGNYKVDAASVANKIFDAEVKG